MTSLRFSEVGLLGQRVWRLLTHIAKWLCKRIRALFPPTGRAGSGLDTSCAPDESARQGWENFSLRWWLVGTRAPASILDVRCSPCSYSNPVPWFFFGGVLLFLFFELCPQALLVCIQFVWPGRLCVVSLACAGRHMVDWGYSCWPSISLSQHMQIVMCTSKKLDRSLCWWDPAVPKCPLGHKQLNRS